jgi:hypothetical protein
MDGIKGTTGAKGDKGGECPMCPPGIIQFIFLSTTGKISIGTSRLCILQ